MSRYMLIMRSTPEAEIAMQEANIDFNEIIESMGRFNEELIKAGVLLAGEGLTGPEEGFVVDFDADPPVVTDGPYTEAKELFNGFWILDVSSKEEAKQWARKVPLGKGVKLEVRRVSETEEFPQDNPWIEKEIQWRADLAEKAASRGAQGRAAADLPASRFGITWRGSGWVRARSRRGRGPALLRDLDVARPGQFPRDVAGLRPSGPATARHRRPGRRRTGRCCSTVHAAGPGRESSPAASPRSQFD